MFLHHVATISLITFSYVNNMARVGTLVMCLHDAADVLIEVRMGEGIKGCGWTDCHGRQRWFGVWVFGVYMLSLSKFNYSPHIMNIVSDQGQHFLLRSGWDCGG